MKSFLLFIIFIIIPSSVFAQDVEEGQLVIKTGDTLQIYANLKKKYTNSDYFGYQEFEFAENIFQISAEDFVSFTSNEHYFKSIEIGKSESREQLIVEVTNVNRYNLLTAYHDNGGFDLFYTKEKGDILKIPREGLEEYVADNFLICQDNSKLRSPYYGPSYFLNLFSMDNSCRFPDQYEYEKYSFRYPLHLNISYFGGLQYSKLAASLSDWDSRGSQDDLVVSNFGLGVLGGISMDINIKPRFGFRYDIWLENRTYLYDDSRVGLNFIRYPFPVFLTFNNLGKNRTFDFSFGLTRSRFLFRTISEDAHEYTQGDWDSGSIGFLFAVAKKFHLREKECKLEFRLDRNISYSDSRGRVQIPSAYMLQTSYQMIFLLPF